ncbi:hypothetical protein LG293_12295 [Citricoccus nitrophenolicus]
MGSKTSAELERSIRRPHVKATSVLPALQGVRDGVDVVRAHAELAARLPEGGAALIDLQDPETPARVEPFEFTAAQIGQLSYRGIAEAWPDGGERMRWRMTYLTLDGERVLLEDTTEHVFHHPSPGTVAAEASRAGLGLERVGETTFWLLTRDQASGSAAS